MDYAFDPTIENPLKYLPSGRNMQTVYFVLVVLFGMVIVGTLVEIFLPGLISDEMSALLGGLAIGILALGASFLMLLLLLKSPTREGFEDKNPMPQWSRLHETYFKKICSYYTEIYGKVLTVEKGVAPNQVPEEQARERTTAILKKRMGSGPVSCAKLDALYAAAKKEDIDTFFTEIQSQPTSFMVQIYDTAAGCREMLIENYNQAMESLQRRKEGFVDVGTPICSAEATEERRKFLRDKKLTEEMKQCLLPEEVPLDKKEDYVQQKIDAMLAALAEVTKVKPKLEKLLEDCEYYKKELDKLKQQAESGSLATSSASA